MDTGDVMDGRNVTVTRDANKSITRATSVVEYLSVIDKIHKKLQKSPPDNVFPRTGCRLWFRGLKAEDYDLTPKIGRPPLNTRYEEIFLSRFKSKTTPCMDRISSLPFSGPPSTYWSWLFLMQHFGVPTRLMEWTQDALTALVFAVDTTGLSPREADKDPVVWCLEPARLNESFSFFDDLEKGYIPNVEEDMVYILFGPDSGSAYGSKPCAVTASAASPRMLAQKTAFTVFPLVERGLPLNRFSDSGEFLYKIRIGKEFRAAIQEQLRHYGITRQALFPEMWMAAETINEEGLQESVKG